MSTHIFIPNNQTKCNRYIVWISSNDVCCDYTKDKTFCITVSQKMSTSLLTASNKASSMLTSDNRHSVNLFSKTKWHSLGVFYYVTYFHVCKKAWFSWWPIRWIGYNKTSALPIWVSAPHCSWISVVNVVNPVTHWWWDIEKNCNIIQEFSIKKTTTIIWKCLEILVFECAQVIQ